MHLFAWPLATGISRSARALSLAVILTLGAVPSQAVTIFVNEIADGGSGYRFGGTGGPVPDGVGETLTGTGTLFSVVRAAADLWESAITSIGNLTINIGWADLAGSTLAQASVPGAIETPVLGADIKFDNTGHSWFLDGTPLTAEEFGAIILNTADLPGDVEGDINTGRTYIAGPGPASGVFDLFSVALHEIGHALGLTSSRTVTDPFIVTRLGLPNFGALIDLADGDLSHLAYSTSNLFPSISSGQRKSLSAIDILAVAQAGGFSSVNLDPQVSEVPEPGTFILISGGLLLIGAGRWRKRAA